MRRYYFLFFYFFAGLAVLVGTSTRAQQIPDQTLGAEASNVVDEDINGLPARIVEGGAVRGSNLFHSFLEFNIGEFEQVYFDSPADIASILSRVTGGSTSAIDGLLGTRGSDNVTLILMNPDGILFGENAVLEVEGAFTATTATDIKLGERGTFSAINPEQDNLLSIQPSVFFFSGLTNRQDISVRGAELQVPEDRSLSLLGRNVFIDGGGLFAPGGSVSLGAISGTGAVESIDDAFVFPENIQRGLIRLENEAQIDVRSISSGKIELIANDIDVLSGSFLLSGVFFEPQASSTQPEPLTLSATGLVTVSGKGTQLSSEVQADATGAASDIQIDAGSVQIIDGAEVGTFTFGPGSAGNIFINSQDSVLLESADIVSSTYALTEGQGGNVEIETGALTVTNDASISANTFGPQNSGDVVLRAARTVLFDRGGALSLVGKGATGQGGDVQIVAESLALMNGSSLNSRTFGEGRGGNIAIQAERDVLFDSSDALSLIDNTARAQGGNVQIAAGAFTARNGAGISSSNFGKGEAGDVAIRAEGVVLFDSSFAFSTIETGAEGKGGDVRITADSISIANGSGLESSTFGLGSAGDVVLQAEETIRFDNSFASSLSEAQVEGQGGDIQISAGSLSLAAGSSLNANTLGRGDAGRVDIRVRDETLLSRSAIFSDVGEAAVGDGRDIQIETGSFSATDDSSLNSSTAGQGSAGNITIQAREDALFEGSGAFSAVDFGARGRGGDVQVAAENLFLDKEAILSASSDGSGDAGSIRLVARNLLQATDSNITTASFSEGNGGNIAVEANALIALGDTNIFSFSRTGSGGDIDLQRTALFSQPIEPISNRLTQAELATLDRNGRVDINATGAIESGDISTNDNVLIDNDLTTLPDNLVDSDVILANSCVVQDDRADGTFTLTGRDRLSQSPDAFLSTPYPTSSLQTVSSSSSAIQEPQGVYALTNGRLIIGHRCEE